MMGWSSEVNRVCWGSSSPNLLNLTIPPNKATAEVRAACVAIVDDPQYRKKLLARARAGTLLPAVECMLWHYAKGKPKDQVEHSGGVVLSWE
jgi:hypothetical protein